VDITAPGIVRTPIGIGPTIANSIATVIAIGIRRYLVMQCRARPNAPPEGWARTL
jgi:hypothetical protein